MLRLTAPVLVEQVLHLLVGYVDLWLTGNFLETPDYVAAMSLVGYLMWFAFNLFAVIAFGATAMTARFVGAGEPHEANRVANQAILAGTAWVACLMAIVLPNVESLVEVVQLEGAAAEAAIEYLRILLWALPAIMLQEVGIACLRGAGDMVSGLVVMAIVNVVNLALGAGLLLGIGPLPELGWRGLAIGATCGHLVGGCLMLLLFLRGRAGYRLHLALLRPDWSLVRRLLRIGVPGGADVLAIVSCHLWFLSIINQLGNLAAAAHGVGVRIEALAYMPGAAFQLAAATLAGQYLGAGDYARASRSVVMACLVGGGLMVTAGLFFLAAAEPLARFFVGGEALAVVPVTTHLLRIVALSMPGLAVAMILGGALRGAGDTRVPLAITFVGFLLVRIPLAYYLAHHTIHLPGLNWTLRGLGLGVVGAWYAMVTDIYVRCALVLWRFRHGGWKRIEV